jgi:RNA polymerase sigma-70 factor (ECF subfamily)
MPQVSYCEAAQADEDICISTDADLVTQLRAGDEKAIAQLVNEWSPAMLRLARSFVDSPQSAEDVVQDTWLGMLGGLAKFEGRSSLRTWAFSILVNRARTRGAREARTFTWSALDSREGPTIEDRFASSGGEHPLSWTSFDVPSRWDTVPENVALSREVLHHLDRALSALPPRQRRVITMRDVCGISADEVCATLNISPQNQRVLLHRARAVLRAALADYYRG